MHDDHQPIPFGAPARSRAVPPLIEESLEMTRQLEQKIAPPSKIQPTYRSCVADSINECRYLDVKGIAKEIMADKKIETPADLADLMAEWAAANKTEAAA